MVYNQKDCARSSLQVLAKCPANGGLQDIPKKSIERLAKHGCLHLTIGVRRLLRGLNADLTIFCQVTVR